MDWTENNALVDWVTPCSSHIPKASTRLEIRTSVKHGLDQILTSTQPPVPQLSVEWALTPTEGLFGVTQHLRLFHYICFPLRWTGVPSTNSLCSNQKEKMIHKFWFLPRRRRLHSCQSCEQHWPLQVCWLSLDTGAVPYVSCVSLLKCHLSEVTRPPFLACELPSQGVNCALRDLTNVTICKQTSPMSLK